MVTYTYKWLEQAQEKLIEAKTSEQATNKAIAFAKKIRKEWEEYPYQLTWNLKVNFQKL